MGIIYRLILVTLLINASCTIATAQQNFFKDGGENGLQKTNGLRQVFPEKYRAASLDNEAMKSFLWSLPLERNMQAKQQAPILLLPMPDGSNARFRVWESSIMHPALQAKFSEIRTFVGQGIDDPYASIRLAYNPYSGFSAQITSIHGDVYIDPYAKGDVGNYISYYTRDNKRITGFSCTVPEEELRKNLTNRPQAGACRGSALYTYRLAVSCTGEYAVAVCAPSAATVNATLAAIVTSVNRVVGLYETELSIRLVLIANETDLIYLDGATDPFTNSSASATVTQNQTTTDTKIGSANYDIGHVFTTGSGGQASLGVVCNDAVKARGTTGIGNPVGDNFDIDYVAHEMGHQFDANHSFNGVVGTCGASSNSSTAFEVGSGTTIMCYAGICGNDNIQLHSDAFFHPISFDEISLYIENGGGDCKVSTPTLNTIPVITAMNNNGINIPIGTPFTLTGTATDGDGDALTYCWEEWDLGPSTTWNGGNANTSSPLFKSRVPKTTGSRTFPDMAVILAGFPSNPGATMGGNKGETLPTQARALKFRLTVRDNRPGGGGVTSGGSGCQSGFTGTFQINTVATSGPFAITAPDGGESIAGGSSQTVTWNVVGTNAAPINCANVRITLSTDGGLTFPNVLATTTANDGTETLSFPSLPSTTARIKIEAIGNIFFDISNNNFTITGPASSFDFNNPAVVNVACPPPATANTTLNTTSNGGFVTPVTLSATGAPSGTNVTFGTNPVIPGNSSTVTLNGTNNLAPGTYTITVSGVAGSITRTRDISFVVQTGSGPVINTPPATQSICIGSPVTFAVAATGATGYQWQFSNDGGTNYVNIPGAVSATYGILSVQSSNGGRYRVNVIGVCNTTTSAAAILTAQVPPAVTSAPQNATICVGSNHTFSVTATGANLTYQWQQSSDGGTNYTNVGGPTSSTYTVNSATLAMNTYRFRVIVAGTCTPSVTSTAAVLTVAGPVVVNTQPDDVEMCSDATASFSITASSSLAIIYQWQSSSNGGGAWQNVVNSGGFSGATTPTLSISNPAQGLDGNLFRVLLTSEACSTPVTSDPVELVVRTQPTVGLSASPLTSLLPGQTTTLTATPSATSGGDLSFQWQYNSVALAETSTTHVVTVEETGEYQVTIQETWPSSLTCSNESSVVTILGTASPNLFIFPSPNSGQFTVSYYNTGNGNSSRTVTVFDSRGTRVHHQKFNISGPYTLLHLDIKPLNGGIFYIVVGDANGKKLAKGKVLIVN